MAATDLDTDLRLAYRAADRLLSDRVGVDLVRSASGDLATASGRDNLRQAVVNRLFTRRGELARLGHPGYGSRLHELLGEPDTPRTRARAELYIRQCLAQEPRLAKVTFVRFEPPTRGLERNTLRTAVGLQPAGEPDPLVLALDLELGG